MIKPMSVKVGEETLARLRRARCLALYSYHQTPVKQCVQAAMTCNRLVFPTADDAARKKKKFAEPWGSHHCYRQCERLCCIVDDFYSTRVVCGAILAPFTKILAAWSEIPPVSKTMRARKNDITGSYKCDCWCRAIDANDTVAEDRCCLSREHGPV